MRASARTAAVPLAPAAACALLLRLYRRVPGAGDAATRARDRRRAAGGNVRPQRAGLPVGEPVIFAD